MRNGSFLRVLKHTSVIAGVLKNFLEPNNVIRAQYQLNKVCSYSSHPAQSSSEEFEPQLSLDLIKIMDQKLSAIQHRHAHLHAIVNQPDALPEEYSKANKELRKLRDSIDLVTDLRNKQKEIEGLRTVIAESQDDKGMQEMAHEELDQAAQEEKRLQTLLLKSLLPKDDADERDCILEVRAGKHVVLR